MRVLVDTNIVLDFCLQREPFFQDADQLFQSIATGQLTGYIAATTLTDIFYIARRHTGSIDQARQAIQATLLAMVVCPVNRTVLESALALSSVDFEDAVQIACALDQGLVAIVTRDRDFASSSVSVLSVGQLLERWAMGE